MNISLAGMNELPDIKAMYARIVADMAMRGLDIWDEVYPASVLEQDIRQKRLYVLRQSDSMAAAFALCDKSAGEAQVQWANPQAKALYLDRLGVDVTMAGKGWGSQALSCAQRIARQMDAEYLRLFVVDANLPAIHFYQKNGYQRAHGVYDEKIDDTLTLREYGFEKALKPDV